MSIKRIRAVDRALLVIEVLSQSGSCSLTELRQKAGLDNAGLLRILGTMIDRGWVRQLIVEKRYELSHSLGNTLGAEARAHPMAEIAVPIFWNCAKTPTRCPLIFALFAGLVSLKSLKARVCAVLWRLDALG
jgi:IclR family mhp operon transcriptional activator